MQFRLQLAFHHNAQERTFEFEWLSLAVDAHGLVGDGHAVVG